MSGTGIVCALSGIAIAAIYFIRRPSEKASVDALPGAEPPKSVCPQCGTILAEDATSCTSCGAIISENETAAIEQTNGTNSHSESLTRLRPYAKYIVVGILLIAGLVLVNTASDNRSVGYWIQQSENHRSRGDLQAARVAVAEAIKLDGKQPKIYSELAQIERADKDYTGAI